MAQGQHTFGRDVQALFDTGVLKELTDKQLLERFGAPDHEAAELAFTVLVERHGPMVLHACRSILRDRHAAEDAFQATFLILSRKAGSLWLRDSIGPWLFGVACRVGWCSRRAASRRRTHEQKAAALVATTTLDESPNGCEAALYEELNRLPERFRLAVVLCDLEGLTQEQAAGRLGWPPGTVRSRLSRGRARLREYLTRRGLAPEWATLSRPAVPAFLAATTVENAVRIAGLGASVMTPAIALTERVTAMMFVSQLKLISAVVLTGGVLVGGTAYLGNHAMGHRQAPLTEAKTPRSNPVEKQVEPKALSDPLSAIARTRLDIAKKLRDNAYTLFQEGETGLIPFLTAQRRYDEVAGAVTVKSDADLVRFNESRLADWKRIEQTFREMHARREMSADNVHTVELDRLDAEEALEKSRTKLAARGPIFKELLEVAKRVRDAKYRMYEGGQIGSEEFLVWQKRYDDVADTVALATGGDRIHLLEERVAELRRVEKAVAGLFRAGNVTATDVDIVRFYRLEADESLARAKAEGGGIQMK